MEGVGHLPFTGVLIKGGSGQPSWYWNHLQCHTKEAEWLPYSSTAGSFAPRVCFTSHLVQPKTTLFAEPCISALCGVIPIWWGFQVSFGENIKKLLAVFSPDKYRQVWNDKIFHLCEAFFVLSDHMGNWVTLRNRSYCLEFFNPASDHLTALWLLWGVPRLSLLACSSR